MKLREGSFRALILSPEAGVEPAAVLVVAAEEAVLHPPAVPVTEPPASVAPVGEPARHFAKLNINKHELMNMYI